MSSIRAARLRSFASGPPGEQREERGAIGEGTDRRRFFSDLARSAVGAVRSANRMVRAELEPKLDQDEQWYSEPPRPGRPTQRALTMEELLVLCEESGLAARSAQIREFARTSLRLTRAEPARGASARSRLGGAPDLPAGIEWPSWNDHDLAFLGQVDLAQAAALDQALPLPERGLLLFFYDAAIQPSGLDPSHRGSCRVLHVGDDSSRRERAGANRARLAEYPLRLSLELTLPRSWSSLVEPLDLDPDEMTAWEDVRENLALAQGVELEELAPRWQSLHRLLGYPDELGSGMELDCQLASGGITVEPSEGFLDPRRDELEAVAADWRLLLQMSDDEELGASWGEDFGRLSMWIRERDLRAGDFDGVWAILR